MLVMKHPYERRFAKIKVVEGTLNLSFNAENVWNFKEVIEKERNNSNFTYNVQNFGIFDLLLNTQQPASGSSINVNDSHMGLHKEHLKFVGVLRSHQCQTINEE